jgi:acyl-CoA reductase-like NAD-dependent aldehyde dehydrogenase
VPAKSGKTFETTNPANEEVLACAAAGDKADVDEAVKIARKAYEEGQWSKMGPHQRSRYLLKIADLIEQNADELATLESLNNGMAISLARGMTAGAVDTFRYYAGWATKIYGETNPSDPSMFNYTLREPVGVCGQIIPWNGPIAMFSWNYRSGNPGRCRQHHYRLRRNRRCGNREPSGYRQSGFHRLDRSGQADPAGLGGQLEAGFAGARR